MKPLAAAALSLVVAALGLAAPSLAEPALPSAWVAGEPGLKDPTADKPKEEVDQETLAFRRSLSRIRRGRLIDIDALPVIPVAKGRPAGEIPAELPAGSPADVVVLKGGGRTLNVAGFEAGVLFVNRSVAYFGPGGLGGMTSVCGPGVTGNALKPIRYEAIRRADKEGSLEVVIGRGFLETSSCRVAIEERVSVRPARLAGGLILGFRTRCDACAEGSREVLHVITPQLNHFFDRVVPLEHHSFSLDKGASKILTGFSTTHATLSFKIPEWGSFSDRGCKKPGETCSHGVRIEVSRADGEAKATVVVSPNIPEN
jgi:hypothetical protein